MYFRLGKYTKIPFKPAPNKFSALAANDAIVNFYENHNSNVSRGVYTLAEEATEIFESGRDSVARFIA